LGLPAEYPQYGSEEAEKDESIELSRRIHGREGLSAGRLPGNGGSGPQHRRLVLRFLQEEVVERHHHPAIIAPSASAHPHKGWALDM